MPYKDPERQAAYRVEYRKKNHVLLVEKERKRYRTKAESIKKRTSDWRLRRYYGITRDEWNNIFAAQGSCCAICARIAPTKNTNWHTDHCHAKGTVRGILCHGCNTAIGKFKDSAKLLRRAADYIEEFDVKSSAV